MAKRGGEQVSLHEVDEACLSHPSVLISVAFSIPNEFWGEEIAVGVVLKADQSDQTLSSAELISHLGTKLANYKVPRQVFFMSQEQLPKSATGKYLRRKMQSTLKCEAVDLKAMQAMQKGSDLKASSTVVEVKDIHTRAKSRFSPSPGYHLLSHRYVNTCAHI